MVISTDNFSMCWWLRGLQGRLRKQRLGAAHLMVAAVCALHFSIIAMARAQMGRVYLALLHGPPTAAACPDVALPCQSQLCRDRSEFS